MAAIALSALCLLLAADEATREKANEFAADLAADLSSDRADQFLGHFAGDLRAELEANVEAILKSADVATTIELKSFQATAKGFNADLDWYLELRRREGGMLETQRRRELIRVEVEKQGRRWRITKLSRPQFFAPPKT